MEIILAAASSGGHWEQMMMLREVFDGRNVHYATTDLDQARSRGIDDASLLQDCNSRRPLLCFLSLFGAVRLVLKMRPSIIISTGAAPGLFCIIIGRMIGAKTLWIDSVANAEQMSLSGRIARYFAHACLTQWRHLAASRGPQYVGSVL